jgi:hypothetical protein
VRCVGGAKPWQHQKSVTVQENCWQIRTDFTTLQLHNYSLKLHSEDYKYKQAEFFTCLDLL